MCDIMTEIIDQLSVLYVFKYIRDEFVMWTLHMIYNVIHSKIKNGYNFTVIFSESFN